MLRARGIHVEIHGRPILHGVDLELRPGEVTVVIGPNGAGKSTLFSVLSGDIAPSRGSVTLDGRPVAEWKPQAAARERAVMVQDSTVSFPFSVREVVQMGRDAWRRSEQADRDEEVVDGAVASVGIEHLQDRTITVVSGGERQRTTLARVLAQEGRTVLLDEPVSAMDIAHQERILSLCRALAAQGDAVAVVLHDLDSAAVYGDRVLLLDHGRVVADGTPNQVCTAELLSRVYGTPIEVFDLHGVRRVMPSRRPAGPRREGAGGPIGATAQTVR
ncbi:heme ABC transporter ATP-binding protein [Citricoccus sp. I39-566]|uniref:heme ABC transporter ATP-binding protein n=1 Tax=Citricoccus sp. I39-566 TaxID=3073268 RepID=UPI00286AB332|nr:heme ABC transporter ATP-binding protein [Citricoccus sp. I39-566]WMY78627.1 heme ABC transporter ATP-binding protein [Citricoccus sp. I39-566]